jgi:hypothetical protein
LLDLRSRALWTGRRTALRCRLPRGRTSAQRSKLAGIVTTDPRERRAIDESFVEGFRAIVWVAVGLAIASSLAAATLISSERRSSTAAPS